MAACDSYDYISGLTVVKDKDKTVLSVAEDFRASGVAYKYCGWQGWRATSRPERAICSNQNVGNTRDNFNPQQVLPDVQG